MFEYFVDENSSKNYFLCSLSVALNRKPQLRKALRLLRMPGQSRIHFVDERDARRRQIMSAIANLRVQTTIIESRSKNQKDARGKCLRALMRRAHARSAVSITLERDESVMQFDRRILFEANRVFGSEGSVTYANESPRSEPLLWIPDAVAWCYAKGGEWRRRIDPLIVEIIRVD